MNIKILGPGCPNCQKTAEIVAEAAAEAGIGVSIEKIVDFQEIARLGVLTTPAVVIDGEIKCVGKVPNREEVVSWLG